MNHDFIMLMNNRQIIRLLISKISRLKTKFKHIDITQCWLRQKIQNDYIDVIYFFTVRMTSNEFIKLLSIQKHQIFVEHFDMINLKKIIIKLQKLKK